MKSLFTALALAGTLTLSAGALAHEHDRGPRMEGPMPAQMLLRPHFADKLGLSQAQKDQIQALLDAQKGKRPSRDQMKAKRDEMKALIEAPAFDETKARAMIAEHADMELAHMKLAHDVMQVLTAEQKDKLAEMRKERSRHDRDE
ncbi:periplasmic heavy metal sensor [Gallaecimonas kandeliae]|uniref:Spy/CpxP family protein refolding chaperone n=1 Tax=Gallaecimonas kandeliae TaxID=3029055 RepID=UPI0026480F7F|nr:periplasmic heavy metal sensor [Gallaecimonas kandeliae]WKE65485.1 periplasmic heavy metal sensor [Gallaecimonas kandeliae]